MQQHPLVLRGLLAYFLLTTFAQAQLSFGPQRVLSRHAHALGKSLADLNGDGLPDFISPESVSGARYATISLADGLAFETSLLITPLDDQLSLTQRAIACDLDGDGDNDVVFQSSGSDTGVSSIDWFENLDGLGHFGIGDRLVAPETNSYRLHDLADLDHDGDLDLLIGWRQGWVGQYSPAMIANLDGKGLLGEPALLDAPEFEGLITRAVDLNGDGIPDLIGRSHSQFVESIWAPGLGDGVSFGKASTSVFGTADPTVAADLDGDGDPDLIGIDGDIVGWFENIDGLGTFVTSVTIFADAVVSPYSSVAINDFNGDGHVDVIAATSGEHRVMLATGLGGGAFAQPEPIVTDHGFGMAPGSIEDVVAQDMDVDGDIDIVFGNTSAVSWTRNDSGTFNTVIPVRRRNKLSAAELFDINGDGRLDLAMADNFLANGPGVSWRLGQEGTPAFSSVQEFSPDLDSEFIFQEGFLSSADVTGDGEPDLTAVVRSTASLATKVITLDWNAVLKSYELLAVNDINPHPLSVVARDFDGDGHLDLLTTESFANTVSLHHGEGSGAYAKPIVLINDATPVTRHVLEDVDADGDQDLLAYGLAGVSWYENFDGAFDFSDTPQTILASVANKPWTLRAADFDDDGDTDLVASTPSPTSGDPSLVVLEQVSPADFVVRTPSSADGVSEFRIVDLDNDGALDLLVIEAIGSSQSSLISWSENRAGVLADTKALTTMSSGVFLVFEGADVDGDEDIDIIVGEHGNLRWYEQGGRPPAFANLGGALAGSVGESALSATGTMQVNQRVELALQNTSPNSPFFLVLGMSLLVDHFQGGVLIPSPDVVLPPLITDGSGAHEWNLRVPPDFEILSRVIAQAWIADPGAPLGFAASNALSATVVAD